MLCKFSFLLSGGTYPPPPLLHLLREEEIS